MSAPRLFTDRADLDDVNSFLQTTQLDRPTQQNDQRFWASEVAMSGDPVQEVMEVTLNGNHLVNAVSFDAVRFPHTIRVEFHDGSGWQPLIDRDLAAPLKVTLLECVPATLAKATAVPGHLHPQHSYTGHWTPINLRVQPTEVRRIRLILARSTLTGGPIDMHGQSVPYSLAIANLRFGYQVSSRSDVPRTALRMDSLNIYDSFATSSDIIGSTLDFSLRVNAATNVLSEGDDVIWRSEPQPYPQAVVNFYADIRDQLGNSQVIDQIFIDPIRSGPHITVYHCPDASSGDFDSPAEPLTSVQASLHGLAGLGSDALTLGRYGQEASVTIDGRSIGFEPTLPWWVGISCQPNFSQGIDNNEHPLFDCGAFRICLTNVGILLATATGERLEMPFDYVGYRRITLIASYADTTLRLRAVAPTDDQEAALTLPETLRPYVITNLLIGTDGVRFGNADLYDFVLKAEELQSDDFLQFPGIYSTVTQFDGEDSRASRNALLRLDVGNGLIDVNHPTGFFGGVGHRYESMVWTPVPRDYRMQHGWLHLPPLNTSFVKLEITNLHVEPRDIHLPTTIRVKNFPPDVIAEYRENQSGQVQNLSLQELGISTQQGLANGLPYADYPIYISTGGTQLGYSNTTVYVAEDITTAQRLRATLGSAWSYQQWHSPVSAPRFHTTRVHDYVITEIAQTTKTAFYAGLRRIQFARTIHTSAVNSGQLEELFQDTTNLAASNWIHDPVTESLNSGGATQAVAQSVAYNSSRTVRGLQFASLQSAPRQLLPDPEFADPQSRNWSLVGDAHQTQNDIGINPLIGTVLTVSRTAKPGLWGDINQTYGALKTAGTTYGDMSNPERQTQSMGGVTSLSVAQPVGGRLYAAARIYANTDLSLPLWVQIVDSVTDVVLSEASCFVKRNQIAEWYTSYAVGDGGIRRLNTYGSLAGSKAPVWPSFTDSFVRPNTATLGQLDSGQQWQNAPGGSLSIVSHKALSTAAGQGNFIDTQTPWGSLSVRLGTFVGAGTAATSVRLIDLGNYQLFNDGRITSETTNSTAYTISPLATGDTLKFDFLPARGLTVGQTPSGANVQLTPYAVMVSRNGSYLTTILSTRLPSTVRGVYGANGQQFQSVSWTPGFAEVPTGQATIAMPMPSNGSLATDGGTWTDSAGNQWPIDGGWTFTTRPVYQASVPVASAATVNAGLYRDFGQMYGTLVFNVTQLASGVSASSYNLATLDFADISLLLRADGAVVHGDGTVVKAAVVPNPTAATIAVRFIRTSLLTSAFKTANSIPNTDSQALIFLQNNTVVGVVSGNNLWKNTIRGINGTNDGAGHFTVTEGFGWFPEGAYLALDTRRATWQDVSRNHSYTYGDLQGTAGFNSNPIQVRVVQKGTSDDLWVYDSIALYHDPIVWEFSNDGGQNFQIAADIRNNPRGALLFNKPDTTLIASLPQNQLVWRVTAYGPGVWISNLVIRPWYQGFTRTMPVRSVASAQGPNINPYDHYAPVEQEPRFQVWNNPIPREWWMAYRNLDPSSISDVTTQWVTLTLGDAYVLEDGS